MRALVLVGSITIIGGGLAAAITSPAGIAASTGARFGEGSAPRR